MVAVRLQLGQCCHCLHLEMRLENGILGSSLYADRDVFRIRKSSYRVTWKMMACTRWGFVTIRVHCGIKLRETKKDKEMDLLIRDV